MIEHSLRVTSLQVLDDPNIDSRHIIRVSGHKNPESVSNYYARRLSAARKRNISSLLANGVGNVENVEVVQREGGGEGRIQRVLASKLAKKGKMWPKNVYNCAKNFT